VGWLLRGSAICIEHVPSFWDVMGQVVGWDGVLEVCLGPVFLQPVQDRVPGWCPVEVSCLSFAHCLTRNVAKHDTARTAAGHPN
jgi:hypothetical protein